MKGEIDKIKVRLVEAELNMLVQLLVYSAGKYIDDLSMQARDVHLKTSEHLCIDFPGKLYPCECGFEDVLRRVETFLIAEHRRIAKLQGTTK